MEHSVRGIIPGPGTKISLVHSLKMPRRKVLVADDDCDFRSLLKEELAEEGFDVIGAGNGVDALCELSFHDFDLIITDWRMPVRNGFELLDSLRTSVPHIPVIFMTAFGDQHVERLARGFGAKAFLSKPFQHEALRNAVRSVLHPAPHPGGDTSTT